MIIIGNKPYKNIDISNILDTFEVNMRFNLGLPGFNNGTKKHTQIVNNHVYDNMRRNNLIRYKPDIHVEYISNLKEELNIKNYPGGIIYLNHNRKSDYNNYLKKNKCPFLYSRKPRMGQHGIMTAVIQGIRPFVTHFSLDQENNKLHLYNKIDNHKQSSICHNPNDEFKILKWLHDNDKIDATLCLLLDTEIPTLECKYIKPKSESIIMLLNKYQKCVLNNFFKEEDIDKLNNQLVKNKIQKFLIKKDSNNIIIEYK